MKAYLLAFLALASCSLGREASGSAELRAATDAFYRWYFSRERGALPSDADMQSLRPIASVRLLDALDRARAAERRHTAGVPPGIKPLTIEGDTFSDIYEGATDYTIGALQATRDRGWVAVHLRYRPHKTVEAEWTDRLQFIRNDGRWVLDDVLRASRGSLFATLNAYAQ